MKALVDFVKSQIRVIIAALAFMVLVLTTMYAALVNRGILGRGIEPVIILAVILAVYGAFANTLREKLDSYRFQSFVLFILAFFTASTTEDGKILFFVACFPLLRALVIAPLMALATVEPKWPANAPSSEDYMSKGKWRLRLRQFFDTTWAQVYWQEYGQPRTSEALTLIVAVVLALLAYLVAGQLAADQSPPREMHQINGLGASLALLLIGLFAMVNENDIPSQIMGLLVMENGLFLAAVTFLESSNLIFFFFLSLFIYIMITLLILAIFAPRLHRSSDSVSVGKQTILSEREDRG